MDRESCMSTLKKNSKNEKMEHSALKTEFRPASKTQAVKLSKSFGVSRFAYNLAVTKASEMLSQKEQYPNFQALRNDMNSRKAKEFPWMFEVPKDISAEAARDAETALKNFFESRSGKRKGKKLLFPRKKKKGKSKDSFRLPSDVVVVKESVDDKVVRVKLGKLGIIKLLEPISLKTWRVTSATVSRRAGRYFISFSVRRPEKARIRNVTKPLSIGLDLGIKNLVTYSNGAQKEGPKSLKKKEKKLKRLSRRLSNKHVTGKSRSRNAIKAAVKIASLHMKITNIRKDFREKETTRLARSYDLVCVESLNVQGMVKNHCLAKSISDQSFGAFVAALERKQETFGMGVLKVGTFFSFIKAMSKVRG